MEIKIKVGFKKRPLLSFLFKPPYTTFIPSVILPVKIESEYKRYIYISFEAARWGTKSQDTLGSNIGSLCANKLQQVANRHLATTI